MDFYPVILVGLALIRGSTDAKALKQQQNILNCLDNFCPILYLYDSNNDQVEYEGSYNKIEEMDVIWAGYQGSGCFRVYNQENFEGSSIKVDSSNSVTLKEWNTVKSIKYLPSAEECSSPEPKESSPDPNAGTSVFASMGIIIVCLLVFF